MNSDKLLISYSHELVDGQPIFVSSNCLPVKALSLEPAGHSFHTAALKLSGYYHDDDKEADDQTACSDDRSQGFMPSSEYSSKGRKKSGSASKQQDHYTLLGLGHLRYLATEDQIRKSYRDAALKHHPDKQGAILLAEESEEARQAKKDEIENHFRSIQEAYEVLIDPVKRRIYDSTDEFDDEIPTDCSAQDFFKVFGPAFMRNGRWSANQPVPSLGEESTPLDVVDSFYSFWYNFKSWREFPHADDFDLEQAESRDHKRWMERQNAKLREKARKDEYTRIRLLVDSAYKRDPRILRRKEEEKAEKQRRKEARYLAKKMQEEEAQKIAEEERRRKEEEEKQAAEAALNLKKMKEKEKKLLRREKARLRTLSAPVVSEKLLNLSEADVEKICISIEMEQLRLLCEQVEHKQGIERAQLLKAALNATDSNASNQDGKIPQYDSPASSFQTNGNISQPAQDKQLAGFQKKENQWGKEEIEMLRKAMQKYPKGTSRRWEVISEYLGTGRSVEEILKATKTVLLQKPDSSKAFDFFLEKRKPGTVIASPLSTRVESGLPVEQVPDTAAASSGGQSASGDPVKENASAGSVATSNGVAPSLEQDIWSVTQERALVQALKAFPKETNQRWERVATAVPGKTVNQCKKKFLLLKESFKSKKSAE